MIKQVIKMPATLTIKSTRTGGKAIDYSSAHNGKDKAHNHNNFDRVLAASGVNCTPQTGKALMQAVWRKKRTKERNMIEAYTVVQSFDPKNFDFRNKKDIELANKMGQELVQKVVPTRLALVYTQADGTHNVIHNHIIICSIDDVTMKAMRGDQKQFKTWANANDRVLREHGYETLKGITSHYAKSKEKLTRAEIGISESKIIKDIYGNEMVQTGAVTRTEKIKERIESLMSDPSVNSWDSFQEKAKDADLDVKIRYNKQGKINGLSYRLLDDPQMRRGIRAKRLGSNYMRDNINDILRQNLERFNEQKIERAKAEQFESHRKQLEIEQRKLEADRRQQNVERREEVTRRKVRQHLLPDGEDAGYSLTNKIIIDSINRNRAKQQHSIPAEQHNERESELDHELSIFDDYTTKISKHIDKTHRDSAGDHNRSKGKSTIDQLIEQLQQQQQLESIKRKQLNRQLAANADFIAFSRKHAVKLARWVDKYYRKSVKFVEQHLSSARHIVQKLTNSVSKPSIQLNESNDDYRNRNKQPRFANSNYETRSASNNRHAKHAKIDPDLDPASKLSTNQFNKDNQIDDDDIPF